MINKQALLAELNKRKQVIERPVFRFNDYCFDAQHKFFRGTDNRFKVAVCSRRCLAAGTEIPTSNGIKKIEDIIPGEDKVFNEDGNLVNVLDLIDQGIQEVVELRNNGKTVIKSTIDHKFKTINYTNYKGKITDNNYRIRTVDQLYKGCKIVRKEVEIYGDKRLKEAYVLGALLGDGCARESGLVISSGDEEVVSKIASILNTKYKKNHQNNYSWTILGANKLSITHYKDWMHKKYAHEKQCSIEEVKTWDKESQLEFIAGLIDTDGSVYVKDRRLFICLNMQSKPVIEVFQYLLKSLFSYYTDIKVDDRPKYKNGPVYYVRCTSNYFSKKIVKSISNKLACERKKYKGEYDKLLESNFNKKYIGITKGRITTEQTYDITIDDSRQLFVAQNSLISHNSGKSVGIAADMIDTAQNEKEANLLYITQTQGAARNIIWGELLKILEEYEIEAKVDNTRLSIMFDNKSKIYLAGAKDHTEVAKFRGYKLRKCYIDEAQSIRPSILTELVNDVIIPALRDLRGDLVLTGTPGPVCAGPYYEYSQSPNWDSQHWSAFDNPFMHNLPELDLNQTLAEERVIRGIDESDPSYVRETYGKWVEDLDSLVFKFNKDRNIYTTLPIDGEWTYVMGVDLGWDDADSVSILGYNSFHKKIYIIEEWEKSKQTITELVKKVTHYKETYNPVKIVVDAGALGKKINEEIRQRHGLHMDAADKARKVEYIELLNDDLRTGKFMVPQNSVFEEESRLVIWDKDSILRNPERPKISDVYHSNLMDSTLYAWRECKHFLGAKPIDPPKINTDEYMNEMEEKEAEKVKRRQESPLDAAVEEAFEQDCEYLDSIVDVY